MFEESDDINDLDHDTSFDSSFDDELQIDWEDIVDPMEFLNQFDYNLNSPIINEHLQELEKYLQKLNFNPIFYKRSWTNVAQAVANLGLPVNQICKNEDWKYHKWVFQKMLSSYKRDDKPVFKEFIIKSVKNTKETGCVLELFLKKWSNLDLKSGEIYDELKLNNLPGQFWFWGDLFLSLHLIVLHMNSTGKKESVSLSQTFKSKIVPVADDYYMLHMSPMLGPVMIFEGYCIIIKENIILDRNMILMGKDMCISRFQVALSILYSGLDPATIIDKLNKLQSTYEYGDRHMWINHNLGYDGIKLIEPICNLRLCELAREFRPKIPEFPDFHRHVLGSIREKSGQGDYLTRLYHQIMRERELGQVLTYYSIFRHWGHPDIEYLEGLKKLHEQTTCVKDIDDDYAQQLASDLAYKILKKMFFEKKKWFVNLSQVPPNHLLYEHIRKNTWPNQYQIQQFGDHWHDLPIIKVFDLPDVVDPSLIYSDKSHSLNRSEVLAHVRDHPNKVIPTKRVLQTLLEKEETNWKNFLQQINDYGLDLDDLVIGLKAKEREMKRIGRYFSLMSWKLREYFVYTEYLIKEFFVPLFKGLTMADDLQEVIKKMLENVSGQGLSDYSFISIANHIDYEKWNNHQRYESNCHIFRIMGECFGLPNLFLRTHEFFQKSLIYYNQRPDLMMCQGDEMFPIHNDQFVCWNGQAGGLEGLRQKGWSIVNLLVIERESKIRNTLIKVLAQGDNQTISTCYEMNTVHNEEELTQEINNIVRNNAAVMNAIRSGTEKLGLIINEDETMVSADYLNYGKVPIFRGIIRGLDQKRWSRVNFGNNDQVPSLGSLLSSVATNSLTVSHFSITPINAMILHNLFANLTIELLKIYNPATRSPLSYYIKDKEWLESRYFRILLIYLDPSIGGVGGTSLTRFLIRMFPDPVTEALSFWKLIADNTDDPNLRALAINCGNPPIEPFEPEHIDKLIENPVGLNIIRGISASNLLKNQVRNNLILNRSKVNNIIVRSSLEYVADEEESLYLWARSIRPLFPRFLSEMVNATYYGITNSIIGMFQNSRTIRNQFRKKYAKRIDDVVCRSELIGISNLIKICKGSRSQSSFSWQCSATHADKLREQSWGTKVLGTTVPHPLEMIGKYDNLFGECIDCNSGSATYLSVLVPKGLDQCSDVKGPYPPYLGSKTSETTSLIQPWDKETNIPLLRRAAKLRTAISWFVEPNSKLAQSILKNLESLTGEDWSACQRGFKRTGSALHRFTCSRQSNGGFSATAPTTLTWMICTTDTMENINDKNYDFMFQSLIIYSQVTTAVVALGSKLSKNIHYHISCKECLREITEPWLESEWVLQTPNVSHLIRSWRPDPNANWGLEKIPLPLLHGDWEKVPEMEKSYHIGHIIGFLYIDMLLSHSKHVEDSSLFPIGIREKLSPKPFFEGLFMGIQRACALQLIHRRNLIELKKPRIAQWGLSFYAIESISMAPGFLSFVRDGPLYIDLMMSPHKLPSSYPLNNMDLGSLVRSYLKKMLVDWFTGLYNPDLNKKIWLFADLQSHDVAGSSGLSLLSLKLVMEKGKGKDFQDKVRSLQEMYVNIKNDGWNLLDVVEVIRNIYTCDQELRHAVKFNIPKGNIRLKPLIWGNEWKGSVQKYQVRYDNLKIDFQIPKVPRRCHPLVSALRVNQFATGAHYKIRSIINDLNLKWQYAICGGDGSGGISSYLCRSNPYGKVLFNSLLMMDGIDFKGSHPSPPSAITALRGDKERCINLDNVWKYPSDLADEQTWIYFKNVAEELKIKWDMIILDMEVVNHEMMSKIENNVRKWGTSILAKNGSIIFKTYIERIINYEGILDKIGPEFLEVFCCQTEVSSSYTSEVYVVFHYLTLDKVPSLYPDKVDLSAQLSKAYCYQNHKSEFNRALKLSREDMMIGVPKEIQSDLIVDYSTLLTILGLESGYSVSIAKSWTRYKNPNHINYIIGCTILVMESNYPTSHSIKEDVLVPSNTKVFNMLSILIGLWSWIALNTGNLALYSKTYDMLNEFVSIYFSIIPTKKQNIKYPTWSLHPQKGSRMKKLRVNDQQSVIGQLLRIWQRMFQGLPCSPDSTKIEKMIQFYNKGLRANRVLKNTSLLDFLLYRD
ncbi:polymerase [Manitoba virus]|uniref:Replicase n=1 Tax=Manitoba virus TaxID=1272949 RepID=A0A0D3R1D6_9RHAB|nr:polymerase [Manitoba virus]AJR28463.1 polymerase [Manitoba virus]